MKRLALFALAWAAGTLAARAEESFSKAVRAGDFSAAGLAKLSPEELARLDQLVRDYKSGALEAAQRQAAVAEAAKARAEAASAAAESAKAAAEAKANKAEAEVSKEKNEPGLLAKAKVMLTPGTKVEYEVVESRIAGDFIGWDAHTIFTLENGQRWQVLNGSSYNTPKTAGPKVKISPASLGDFWMVLEGVNQRVKVKPFGVSR